MRKNGVLLYELLDEVVDYGFPQNSSSEALREFVLNEPTVLHTVRPGQAAPCHTVSRSARGFWSGQRAAPEGALREAREREPCDVLGWVV